MTRRTTLGSANGALGALAVTAAVLAGSCASDPPGNENPAGSGATTGGTAPVAGSSTTGGSMGTTGGSAGSTSGSGGSTGGALPSAGTGGTGPTGGTGTGGTPTAGDGGLGGTPPATGGTSTAGQAGSPTAGTAGEGTAGTGGASSWWFNGPREPPLPNGSWPPPAIKLTEVSAGTQPTAIAAPRADASRLFLTEKWGIVRVIKDGQLVQEPVLDIRAAVLEGGPQGSTGPELMNQGKRGLVGLAFHPNYEENGRVFVMYTADQGQQGVYGMGGNLYDDGDMTFAEYRRSATNPDKFDPEPVSVFLQFDKGNCDQCSQHNGGSLEIDVDGFLWASTGDPPPYNNPGSQDLMNLNGKLLRFDISGTEVTAAGNYPGADPYVASIGIRNAYKISVDRYKGDIYVGDVGENTWEEVTVEQYGQGKKDHGWPKKEGNHGFMGGCTGCLDPVHEYNHNGGAEGSGAANCIIGGYVYRGTAIPALHGAYVYGDNGSGEVRAIQVTGGALMGQDHIFTLPKTYMGCFGEDAAGELYVCDYNNNKILRVDAQ